METKHIELFVDRLCAYFPGAPVSAHKLKQAWMNDRVLRLALAEDGAEVLRLCLGSERMPSLGVVHALFAGVALRRRPAPAGNCVLCDGTFWVYPNGYGNGVTKCECV